MTNASADAWSEVGYGQLVRQNTMFRRLWLGNIVSLLGDWFNTIALYALVLELTGSELALGAVFISKMLPSGLASPVAGLLVDRLNRRRVMIGADVLRAVVVLGFLVIDQASEVWLLYTLVVLQTVIGSVFRPAQNSSVPNITAPNELVTANALMAATWSTMLAFGAAAGGIATEYLGLQAVFILDSLTYLLSAWFIWRTVIPQDTDPVPAEPGVLRTAARDVIEGWKHMVRRPEIGRMALAKATWAIAGGGLVFLLALMGEAIEPAAASVAIGVLFAARGVGTGIGPIAARALARDRRHWPFILGACISFSGLCYLVIGLVPWSYWIVGLIVLGHATSGANWVLSNVLLQERTEDRWRGRVFATEWLTVMAADTVAILSASLLLEWDLMTLAPVVMLLGGLQIISGIIWIAAVVPAERRWSRARVPGRS
ncbi:MAG: MFS transporter [Rhodothermales bacterium]|nr:MFS transporter [Rhodothermales bacterium]MBO6778344.1 MFS transporter [Rhodothermales bacterium]